jgi:hypothetical protein
MPAGSWRRMFDSTMCHRLTRSKKEKTMNERIVLFNNAGRDSLRFIDLPHAVNRIRHRLERTQSRRPIGYERKELYHLVKTNE